MVQSAGTGPYLSLGHGVFSRGRGPRSGGDHLGHRRLPASLPSSAWILATSTAARPGLSERTIRTRRGWGGGGPGRMLLRTRDAADLRARARLAFSPSVSSHTLQPPQGAEEPALWSSRWMGPRGREEAPGLPDIRPADAVFQSARVQNWYKGRLSASSYKLRPCFPSQFGWPGFVSISSTPSSSTSWFTIE